MGESLAGTLGDPASATDRDVYLPYMAPGQYAVFNRQWRYINYGDDGEELYDLRRDPNEWNNLASDERLASVKVKLRQSAPGNFAQPEAKLNPRKGLVIDGDTFRWAKGQGNYKPEPKYRPYTSVKN